MGKERVLVKNTIIVTIGKICTQMLNFLLLPLYTSILTTAEYGIIDLINTLTFLLIPIITFQMEQAIFRFLVDARNEEKEKMKIISSAFFSVIFQSTIFGAFFFIITFFIKNEYSIWVLLNIIAIEFSGIFLQILRGIGDNKTYAFSSFITAAATIIFNIIFLVIFKVGIHGMLLATFLGNIICTCFIIIKKKIYKYIKISLIEKKYVFEMWKYSIPLIPNALSWWIVNSSDRLIVTSFLGLSATGLLAISYKFSNLYMSIYNILNITWTESVAVYIKSEDSEKYINRMTDIIYRFFSSIALGIIAFMPFVFNLLVDSNYIGAYNQIPILMLAVILNMIIGLITVIFIANKDTVIVAKTTVISAIINILINFTLIRFIGLYAATFSTVISYLVMAIYRYINVQKYIRFRFNNKVLISTIIVYILIVFPYYLKNNIGSIIMLLITIVYAIYLNFNLIKNSKVEIRDILNKKKYRWSGNG